MNDRVKLAKLANVLKGWGKMLFSYAEKKFKFCWMNIMFFIKNRIKLSCSFPLNLMEY